MINKSLKIFLIISFILFFKCKSAEMNISHFENENFIGWVNDNTIQVKGIGMSDKNISNKIQRRNQAKNLAISNAKSNVMEIFIGHKLHESRSIDFDDSNEKKAKEKIEKSIKKEAIINEVYDNEDNCQITYRVISEGLKKLALEQ